MKQCIIFDIFKIRKINKSEKILKLTLNNKYALLRFSSGPLFTLDGYHTFMLAITRQHGKF